jgi:hypothetical protein
MVLNIKITSDELIVKELMGENILENKNIFINYLMGFIIPNFKNNDSCDHVNIILPTIVTKDKRHIIHKMSCSLFNSNSYNNNEGQRYMVISLNKKLILNWINITGYQFPPEDLPIREEFDVIEDNKEQEFNILMKIILTHYREQFDKWKFTQM